VRRSKGHRLPWLVELLKRSGPKFAAVALANKTGPGAGWEWRASSGSR
jgi:hypothetical protein